MSISSKPALPAVSPWATMMLDFIDSVIQDRVLVYGSLPPEGGDLDLLARPAELSAIREALIAAGFVPVKRMLVRFRHGTRELVELTPADFWGLPPDELEALLAEAEPIDGAQWLVRPSPHHTLLIRARKIVLRRPALQKPLSHPDALSDAELDAWRRAGERAAIWRARRALGLLQFAHKRNGRVTTWARWSALLERLDDRTTLGVRGRLRMLREFFPSVPLPCVRKTRVIAFCGLDGSGKSSQARLLRNALLAAGYDVTVIWAGIGTNRSLGWIKAPVKRFLRALPRVGPFRELVERVTPKPGGKPNPLAEPGKRDRHRDFGLNVVTQVWVGVMALTNIYSLRKVLLRAFGSGRIVIFDRYTLDSAVRLRHWYGNSLATKLVIRLVHRVAKRPIKAYFLDVPPRVAFERKPEWELDDLESRAAIYHAEYLRLGVRRLDGTRPPEEICDEIAAEVWGALR